ncbi:germinal-center associated nuclear protein isoform X1 [Vidua chalybeata]|uniref:germinal-center associated nuclear protein isoform X1 n=1 Tax=Vidua chalybeata TaxID=81927 RepID=UPI0023A79B97|nr:germinal-center associated nuclear protein isoform X1 [Vidua chalybeata]
MARASPHRACGSRFVRRSEAASAAMSARGPFRSPPSFPAPLRFGQPAVFGQGSGPAGLPFTSAATFAPPYALGQAPAPAGNAGFSFRPPTSLGGFPTSSEASGGGGGAFAAPEFHFKAPESAAAFKPISGGEVEKGPAAPAAFAFSSPFAFASETGPEAAVAREPISFSRPAAALGRPDERGLRALPQDPGEPPSKGLKRKEERERSPRRAAAGGRAAAPPEKRAVVVSRPRGGILFGRTLEDLLRSQAREQRERGDGPETERGLTEEPPPAETRDPAREDAAPTAPACRSRGSESTEGLGVLPAAELTAVQCKNIPDYLNDRTVLEKHFGQFAKVRRIMTRRNKKMAVLHFFDHASAVLARKKAKELHKDIVTFWQKKKTSPAKREFSSKEKKAGEDEGRQSNEEQSYQHSPLRKPLIRSSASSVMPGRSSPAKKPGLRKTLQFEAELFDSSSEGQSSEGLGPSLSSLSNLVGLVAETSEERYRLLDQRDKIMRQARIKRTDLGKAKTVVGTCPDMCPEKERYMRETRSQLSIFELLLGTDKVDHAAAIKEYSRSSADQEEPLPHELRPSEVLSMTMDYLVTNIMDQGEGNYREWYDFVWNRTRGIRKDITQQHLCNPLMVSLIEKCTRFHIHCAHHLCEEPMSSFDAKINNENMTKCLQSLKEMYQDLANKGIYCKSEAEFRGYNVLLNLNKGDILREVQQFHPEVRNSPEVRFAVQAFAALNSNNFVRFFKLVQAASYLNACLLHCYFNQIRKDGLKSLNIAYTVSTQRSTAFPLDHLVRMLLFKDCEEATDFISYYGLSVSDGGYVELNRSAFLEPDGLPKPRKSLFVSQKLTVSVGEVVNGGPLPPVPHHVPVSSFNGQNKYIGGSTSMDQASSSQKPSVEATEGRVESRGVDLEATAVRVQSSSHLLPSLLPRQLVPVLLSAQPISQSAAQPEPPPSKPQPGYSDEDIAEVVDGLVHDVLKGECREVGRAGAAYMAAAICASEATVEELVTVVMGEILREVAGNMLSVERQRVQEERRRVEEERQKQEREELIKQLSQLLGMELMEEVIKESVKEASVNELRCALERDQQARIARCSEEVCGHFMVLFLEDEIFQIAKETLQELQCFCKYLKRWREAVAARTKLKRQMRAFPAAPCGLDSKHQLKALSPSAEWPIAMENLCKRFVNLGNGGKLGISCTRLNLLRNKTVHEIKVQHFYQQLVSDLAWTPLDLVSLIMERIPVQQEQVFWKALLVLPSDDEYSKDDPNRILMDWLKAKFMGHRSDEKNASHTKGKIQTLTLFSSPGMQGTRSIKVSVCIKVAHGALSNSELDLAETQKDLLGTSGLVLLLPPRVSSEDVAEDDVYWLSALLQLKQLLQAKPFHPIVPLVVLVPSQKEEAVEKEVEDGLMLQDLISAHLISDYTIVELPGSVNDLEGTRRVSAAVGWLVSHCPASLELCSQTLQEYIEDGIDGEFGKRFYHDWKERRSAGLPSQEPGVIIELYNSVLQFLSDVASSEHFYDLSWPVTEFSEAGGNKMLPHLQWNMPDHLAWLKKAVLSFQIPYLDLPPLGAPWRPVCHMIFQYVSQIANSSHTQPLIQSQVENLLSKTYQNWKTRTTGNSDEDGPSVDEIPWDCILAVCIDHKLRDWKPPKLPVAPEAISKDGQIRVYFFKGHLKNYSVPFSWDQARLRTQEEIRQGHERSKIKSPKSFKKPCSISVVPGQYGSGMSMLPGQEVSIPSTDEFRDTSLAQQHLLAQLQLEKVENKRGTVQDGRNSWSCQEWLETLWSVMPPELKQYSGLCVPSVTNVYKVISGMSVCSNEDHKDEELKLLRFEEQLHQYLAEDMEPLGDLLGLPLYLPQSLLSTPAATCPLVKSPMSAAQEAGSQEEHKIPELEQSSALSDRLKHLQQLLRATKEAEAASELHLSALVDMVDI